jgi:hypothetical protein
LKREEEFPPELPDMKSLYTDFYNEMTGLTRLNLVCASCGCIEHHLRNFEILSVCDASLRHLTVDPSLVPFNFTSSIARLDNLHIMIDPLGVVSSSPSSPKSKCKFLLQLERARHPPATGHYGLTKYLASPVVLVTRHCSSRMGGTACAKHGRIARLFFRENSKSIRRPHIWLVENNEDYKDLAIDHSQFERWPPQIKPQSTSPSLTPR